MKESEKNLHIKNSGQKQNDVSSSNSDTHSDSDLMKKFTTAKSKSEIEHTAEKIIDEDSDIDKEELHESQQKFREELKKDAREDAINDAQFQQPS